LRQAIANAGCAPARTSHVLHESFRRRHPVDRFTARGAISSGPVLITASNLPAAWPSAAKVCGARSTWPPVTRSPGFADAQQLHERRAGRRGCVQRRRPHAVALHPA
jgi:hypothetical protein